MKSKFIQTFIIAVIVGLITTETYSQEKNPRRQVRTEITSESYSVIFDNSDGSFTFNITYKEEGKLYKMKVVNSKIVEMTADGKKVPPEEFSKYDKMLEKILAKIGEDRKKAEEDRKHASIEREKAEFDREQSDNDREHADRERDNADRDREHADAERDEASRERDRASRDTRTSSRDRKSSDRDRRRTERDHERAQEQRADAETDRRRSDEDRERASVDRTHASKERDYAQVERQKAEEDRKFLRDLLGDVVSEKLVKDEDEVRSLVLDEKKLIINDKTQTEELHKKFEEKYLRKEGSRIHYRNDRNFRGISIDN